VNGGSDVKESWGSMNFMWAGRLVPVHLADDVIMGIPMWFRSCMGIPYSVPRAKVRADLHVKWPLPLCFSGKKM
jgi:hypothetical protein